MKAPNGLQVDHIDGDVLNNQKSNLRICTQQENAKNRKINKNNTSGIKGVSKTKRKEWRSKTWQAIIGADGKNTHLGYFYTAEEAGRAYKKAAKELYGDFARY